MGDGLTKPIVVGYSLKQVFEMLLPAGTALVVGLLAFTDYKSEMRNAITELQLVQDVTSERVDRNREQARRQSDGIHKMETQQATMNERTEHIQEDLKEIKGLLNEAVRKLNTRAD